MFFSIEFCEIFRNILFYKRLQQLLLSSGLYKMFWSLKISCFHKYCTKKFLVNIACNGVSPPSPRPLKNTNLLFLAKSPILKSANGPSPPPPLPSSFLDNPPYILLFRFNPSNTILDFDNKLMEVTKNFSEFLEDISKGVRFYKAAALQPICLLKEHSF